MRGATWRIGAAVMLGIAAACGAANAPTSQPASRPTTGAADAEVEWLLRQATGPATQPGVPTSGPVSPLVMKDDAQEYRRAIITFSDGEKLSGRVATTAGKPIRVWEEQKAEYRDIPYKLIQRMEAKVLWEREEREWHFRESGSDIKEYSGKTYPARELQYTITLVNGQSVSGGVVAPLYLDTPGGDKVLVLHKRDKGKVGQTLKDLAYVQRVEFEE